MPQKLEDAMFIAFFLLVAVASLMSSAPVDAETCMGRHPFISSHGCSGTIGGDR